MICDGIHLFKLLQMNLAEPALRLRDLPTHHLVDGGHSLAVGNHLLSDLGRLLTLLVHQFLGLRAQL